MKAILMSIRPQHLVNILNGKKTIELRKKFPSDFRGWVYCYCTKTKPYITQQSKSQFTIRESKDFTNLINGKVVCRFWVDNVDTYYVESNMIWLFNEKEHSVVAGYKIEQGILRKSCVSLEDFKKYAKPINEKQKRLFAIHISKLEIFDKPKELAEFYYYTIRLIDCGRDCPPYVKTQVHKAPQSWRYIYIKEDK